MSFEILNNPPLSTIQDNGRFGLMHLGITNSGAMDMMSYTFANHLLNNKLNTNCIEIYHGNLTIKVNNNTTIALTGAQCNISINSIAIQSWRTHKVQQGDIIKIGSIQKGLIVYLCVKNGFSTPFTLNSYTTTVKEQIGGVEGRKLKKGDILNFPSSNFLPIQKIQTKYIPKYPDTIELRVMLSYQHHNFSNQEKEKFFLHEYTLSNEINRMGYKLYGEKITSDIDGIISEGITFGSIQIPKDGQPIILLKEHQTIGGYPKIGVVLDVDCYKLAQARPNTKIRFKEISFEEATKISKRFLKSFSSLKV
jgi:biotin-dependent carboxylase-like uncharacterized protein